MYLLVVKTKNMNDSCIHEAQRSHEKEWEMEKYQERENERYDNYKWDEDHGLWTSSKSKSQSSARKQGSPKQ